MWKMLLAFVVFAAVAMFVLIQSGADVEMGGEQHGVGTSHTEDHATSAPASASEAAPVAAPAASAAASPASN